MRYLPNLVLATAALFAGAPPAIGRPFTVRVARIDDNRVVALPKAPQPFFSNLNPPGLVLTLYASGPMARVAVSFGKVKVAVARDNRGDVLRLAPASTGDFPMPTPGSRMHKIQRQPAGFGGHAPRGFDVPLALTQPPRRAQRIAVLRGSFRVIAGGKLHSITLKPQLLIGKRVNSPLLAKAGLHIKILKSMPAGIFLFGGSGGQSLILSISGHKAALEKVKVLSASGKSICTGDISNGQKKGAKISAYQLTHPLRAGDKLVLAVATGQKAIKVPFAFRNLTLP